MENQFKESLVDEYSKMSVGLKQNRPNEMVDLGSIIQSSFLERDLKKFIFYFLLEFKLSCMQTSHNGATTKLAEVV